MRNAFGSVLFEVMERVFCFLIDSEDWGIFKQRIYCTSTTVPGLERKTHFSIGSGPLPGDQIAADLFRITFKNALEKWISKDSDSSLLVTCPITKVTVDAGKSCYADDLCSKHVFEGAQCKAPSVNEIEKVLEKHDEALKGVCVISVHYLASGL